MVYICYNCKTELKIDKKVFSTELCPKCSVYVKCCLNCKFYKESAYHGCLEPIVEFVKDKEGKNFCEYFVFRESEQSNKKEKRDIKSDFNKLFNK